MVDHTILLDQMRVAFGIDGLALDWIRTFQVFKYFPSLMPPVFKKYVVENCNIHCHDTRSCTDLHRFQNNFNVGHKSLKVKGAQLWNTLPQHLKERSTINKFKKELRFYLINFSG